MQPPVSVQKQVYKVGSGGSILNWKSVKVKEVRVR